MMRTLAEIGFHQSYTYFTWRNGKDELEEYLTRAVRQSPRPYPAPEPVRQHPGHPARATSSTAAAGAFEIRAVLAATLGPTWGVYSGYELCENAPAAPGSEEYLDSEKYQLRPRDWAGRRGRGPVVGAVADQTQRPHGGTSRPARVA